MHVFDNAIASLLEWFALIYNKIEITAPAFTPKGVCINTETFIICHDDIMDFNCIFWNVLQMQLLVLTQKNVWNIVKILLGVQTLHILNLSWKFYRQVI